MAYKVIFMLGLVLALSGVASAAKLNYPRVLLPIFNKIYMNFTLEVMEKGCFKWTSSRQDLILLTPLYDDSEGECSYRAAVTVLTRERRRNTAIVLAEDRATGESLRCDVIVDVIDKLGVHTTTRQLYLEEAPETFELRAEDSQGNAFTSLEGIEFSWVISSLGSRSANKNWTPALRFLTFSESPYHEVPPELEKFEAQRLKGYMVLLEGINTGTAKVTISIPYPEYSHVPKMEVYINVLANIILEPSEVHMLTGDTINFSILQLKMGKLTEISLNDQYFLEIENSNVATIKGTTVTGFKLGRTTLILRDRNAPVNEENGSFESGLIKVSAPSALITVAEPVRLGLSLLPYNNWITVAGEHHVIALDLYTRDDQKMTLGSRYAMITEYDDSMFTVYRKNKNNTRLYGELRRDGVTPVYGEFRDLTAQAEIQVFSRLFLSPSKVILPYDPNVVKTQKIQFHAQGGDGSYIWLTQNQRVLLINQNGLATTVIRDTGKKLGHDSIEEGSYITPHSSIRLALTRNPKIVRQADVYFLPPIKLEILKYNFETALDDYVRLQVAMYAYVNESYVPFTRCENLIFDFEFSNQIFQVDYNEHTTQLLHGACQVIHLRSTAIGLTHLRLSYNFQDRILKDEVTLSVFEKLVTLNPVENEIVLPIGASRNFIYANGPQRMFTLEAEMTKSTEYDKKIAEINELTIESQELRHVFNVLCRKVGKITFTLNLYNAMMAANFQPYLSKVDTTIYCVKPRFLNLYATERMRDSCPLEVKNSLLHLKERDDKFQIEIEVQDAKNRKLMNITSLVIDWEFTAGDERYSNDTIKYYRYTEEDVFGGVHLPGRDMLITTITDVAQNLRIKGIVKHYNTTILHNYHIEPEEPHFSVKNPKTGEEYTPDIENDIRFTAVNSTLFANDHISIFMARHRSERIPITQGSSFYNFVLHEQNIVNVEYDAKAKELILTPLRVGHARLEVTDRCLMTEPAHLSISVVNIGAIEVEALDRVERTKSIEAVVKLYDTNDNLLQIDPIKLFIYQLSEEIFNADILSVTLGDQNDLEKGEVRYIITGNNLGETKIVFSAGSGDLLVSSEPLSVQVFPPLRLFPRNSTLVVGSSVQIYYHGGPRPDANIVFYVHDKKVISMESAVVTAHKLGETKITGKCIMNDPRSGKEIVISYDTVESHVVPLVNIQIKTPLIRIRSGAVMPAAIWGMPDLSPMVLGTLENTRVTWTTNQPDVLDIYNMFADAGIEYSSTDLITVRVKALNPGKAKIQATVELSSEQKFTSSVEVIVFKTLELVTPRQISRDWILIAPRSTVQLKANLEDVVYKPDVDSSGIVKVTSDGIVRTQETLGRDLIIAKTYEQSLPIGVEVKNVHYILATLSYPTSRLRQTEEKLPRGMTFEVKISLHDNLGNEFSHNIEDVIGLKCDLSRKDILDMQIGNNLTIVINLPRETNNMIAVSLKDTTGVKHAEDYIKLSVAESKHIFPTKTVFSVGDIICFDSPLTLASVWSSSDEHIISINKFTGVARVVGNRYKLGEKVVISHGDTASGSYIKYDVEVRDADVIQILKNFDIFNGGMYIGHLVLRSRLQADKLTNLMAKNISSCARALEEMPVKLFTCRLTSKQSLGQQLLEHYSVTPIFEVDSGRYACQIELTSSFYEVLGIVKNNDVHFELEARLPNGLADAISLKFVPGVRVSPKTLHATELNEQELTIIGLEKVLQKVVVKASDEKYLQLIQQTKSQGMLQYFVEMVQELPPDEHLFIKVHSPATAQDIEIPIIGARNMLQTCSMQPFSKTSSAFLNIVSNIGLVVTTVAIATFIFWMYVFLTPPHNDSQSNNNEVFQKKHDISDSPTRMHLHSGQSTPLYPDLSIYGERTSSISPLSPSGRHSGIDTQVYGDSILVSPQNRTRRRYF